MPVRAGEIDFSRTERNEINRVAADLASRPVVVSSL
jgi:hypothetical protein